MAIVKLVCQGCGANLDAKDDQRVAQCGYCGTTNQIKQTVQQPQPQFQPQAPPITNAQAHQQLNQANAYQVQQAQQVGSAVKWIVLIAVFAPLLLGGFIAFTVFRATSGVLEKVGLTSAGASLGLGSRRYMWENPRPFVADVNGDGTDDIIGAIMEFGAQNVTLTAMSGSDWSTLWEVDLGARGELPDPAFFFEPGSKLVLLRLGATLQAYDGASGQQRWIANLPDKLDRIALDGQQLWVRTIDEEGHHVSMADGKVSDAKPEPSDEAKALLDGEGYELIPELGTLDLKSKQFEDLRVEKAFCPKPDLPLAGKRHRHDEHTCKNPNGLAFAVRAKGTGVPFLVGYERESKAERWRVQLTKAGTLATVDTGFGQPRAEYLSSGDDAIISYVPANDDNARIRRISLADGSTKWETTLTRKTTDNVDAMVAGSEYVFVTYGQRIIALQLDGGGQVAELGGV